MRSGKKRSTVVATEKRTLNTLLPGISVLFRPIGDAFSRDGLRFSRHIPNPLRNGWS
jgi:hypothetical protein